MSSKATAIPPFKRIAAALRKTTEHLAGELVRSSDAPPDWSEFEWAVAQSVAAMQGISTLLANNLRWQGPPAWEAFLAEQRKQSLLRDARIDELLRRLDIATRDAGIGCVALKGAALRALGLYRPGERPMGDVDLLLRADDATSVEAVLRRVGYRLAYTTPRHVVYEPHESAPIRDLGEHIDNPLKIEVHTTVADRLPIDIVDITPRVFPTKLPPGLNAYPDAAALMLHLLLHASGNMRAHSLRQIQLNDIARLAQRLSDTAWDALLTTSRGEDELWWVYSPFALTARYYPGSIPREILHRMRGSCPIQLRFSTDRQKLTDVSWSNLRIHALPGIAWSRTPLEALRYVRSRALPSRKSIADLRSCLEATPQLNGLRWYALPHGKRIAHWLFSRPPRVQTMLSVAAALENSARTHDAIDSRN